MISIALTQIKSPIPVKEKKKEISHVSSNAGKSLIKILGLNGKCILYTLSQTMQKKLLC